MRGLGGLVGLVVCVAAASVQGAITPYPGDDADTAVLYHLNEPSGTQSSGPADYVVTDARGNVPLRTDVVGLGMSPFEGVNGPAGLGAAMTSRTNRRAFREGVVGVVTVFATDQFTIEAWVKAPDPLSWMDEPLSMIFSVFDGGEIQFAIKVDESEERLYLKYNGRATALLSDELGDIDDQAWYHAAVVYDDHGAGAQNDSTVTFYFTPEDSFGSGVQVVGQFSGLEDLEALGDDNGHVAVGERYGAYNFNGYIDEVRYSNVVRSFSGVIPESGSLVALGIALLGMRRRRA